MEPDTEGACGKATPTIGLVVNGFRMGGLERTVLVLVDVLSRMGARIVLLTAYPAENDFYQVPGGVERICLGTWSNAEQAEHRRALMKEAIEKHKIDIIVFHSYFSRLLPEEIALVHSTGCRAVVHCHSAGTSFFARKEVNFDVKTQFAAFRAADALIALSRVDEVFFRALGIRARYIPNPVRDVPPDFCRRPHQGHSLFWIGRFDSRVKRPLDAVRILELVRKRRPDVTLTMLGNGPAEAEVRDFLKQDPSLCGAVRMPGGVKDVWQELAGADLLLFTSTFEGFPGVVAEAYAAGVPVVGYRLDSVELCNVEGAYSAVEQGDVEAAAAAVASFLENPDSLRCAGQAAREAFARFAAFDQGRAYRELVDDVLSGRDEPRECRDTGLFTAAINSFFAHACEGRRFYRELLRESRRPRRGVLSRVKALLKRVFSPGSAPTRRKCDHA